MYPSSSGSQTNSGYPFPTQGNTGGSGGGFGQGGYGQSQQQVFKPLFQSSGMSGQSQNTMGGGNTFQPTMGGGFNMSGSGQSQQQGFKPFFQSSGMSGQSQNPMGGGNTFQPTMGGGFNMSGSGQSQQQGFKPLFQSSGMSGQSQNTMGGGSNMSGSGQSQQQGFKPFFQSSGMSGQSQNTMGGGNTFQPTMGGGFNMSGSGQSQQQGFKPLFQSSGMSGQSQNTMGGGSTFQPTMGGGFNISGSGQSQPQGFKPLFQSSGMSGQSQNTMGGGNTFQPTMGGGFNMSGSSQSQQQGFKPFFQSSGMGGQLQNTMGGGNTFQPTMGGGFNMSGSGQSQQQVFKPFFQSSGMGGQSQKTMGGGFNMSGSGQSQPQGFNPFFQSSGMGGQSQNTMGSGFNGSGGAPQYLMPNPGNSVNTPSLMLRKQTSQNTGSLGGSGSMSGGSMSGGSSSGGFPTISLDKNLTYSVPSLSSGNQPVSGSGTKWHTFSPLKFSDEPTAKKYIQQTGLETISPNVTQDWGGGVSGTLLKSRRGSISGFTLNPDKSVEGFRFSSFATSEALKKGSKNPDQFLSDYDDAAKKVEKRAYNTALTDSSVNAVLSDVGQVKYGPSGFQLSNSSYASGFSGVGIKNSQESELLKIYGPTYDTAFSKGKARDKNNAVNAAYTYHSEGMATALHEQQRGTKLKNEPNTIAMVTSIPNQVCKNCGDMLQSRMGSNSVASGMPGIPFGGQKPGVQGGTSGSGMAIKSTPLSELRGSGTNQGEVKAIGAWHNQ